MSKSYVSISGIDVLKKKLKENASLDDVKRIVHEKTADLDREMQRIASPGAAFKKGYSVGHLKQTIKVIKRDNGLTGEVGPTAEYAPYLEYGTRFMKAEPFAKPALDKVGPEFIAELQKLCK